MTFAPKLYKLFRLLKSSRIEGKQYEFEFSSRRKLSKIFILASTASIHCSLVTTWHNLDKVIFTHRDGDVSQKYSKKLPWSNPQYLFASVTTLLPTKAHQENIFFNSNKIVIFYHDLKRIHIISSLDKIPFFIFKCINNDFQIRNFFLFQNKFPK